LTLVASKSYNMPKYTKQDLRNIFNQHDTDGNGTIEWDEFCDMLDELLGKKTLEEKCIAFNLVDTNRSGMISFEEFSEWWLKEGY
jgi:Ca2+-binding EF-hand superfamily protein